MTSVLLGGAASSASSTTNTATLGLLSLMGQLNPPAPSTVSSAPALSAPVTSAPTSSSTAPTGSVTQTAPAAPTTHTYVVNSVAGLTAALNAAHSGDTIKLAAGGYAMVQVSNFHFDKSITITSADSTHKAVLEGLKINNSSGIAFNNVEMTTVGSGDAYYGFRVSGSQNIAFDHVDVHGDANLAPSQQLSGFYVSGSSGFSLTNSALHNLNGAVIANNDQNVTFSGNAFTHMSKGGIMMGGTSNVSVDHNTFTDFNAGAGVHGDAVQVYTAGITTAASDISITHNTVFRGSGDAIQGIWVQDETQNLPFHNLTITDNQVIGGIWGSVLVNGAVTGTLNVSNNLATTWAGLDMGAATATSTPTTNFAARVVLNGDYSGAQVTATGNTAQQFIVGGVTVAAPAGNTQVGAISAVNDLSQLADHISVVATTAAVVEHHTVSGNLLGGATGGSLYLADVGLGAMTQKAVGAAGLTIAGAYGSLTVNSDGSYTYAETKDGLVAGQTYMEHFVSTVANQGGQAVSSTLDIAVTGWSTGDGGKDYIVGGSGTQTYSGFGAGSTIVSGTGLDTFRFDQASQSTPAVQTQIQHFKAGDILDLSHLDPSFHIVTKQDGHAHELSYQQLAAGNWMIYGDINGGGVDFQLHVTGAAGALTADSFHLV